MIKKLEYRKKVGWELRLYERGLAIRMKNFRGALMVDWSE